MTPCGAPVGNNVPITDIIIPATTAASARSMYWMPMTL